MHESQHAVEQDAPLAEPERTPITEQDAWLEESGELPPRPRRRILAPVPVALFLALAVACGFIGGVLVEKGQGASTTSARSAGGFGAPTGRASTSGRGSATASGATGSGPAFARGSGGFGSAARGAGGSGSAATIGEVAYVSGSTLYVKTAEGNTVKVTAAPGAGITKTVEAHVKGIHPGETVLVSGSSGAGGSISASSIRAGGTGGAAGGLGLTGGGAGLLAGGTGGGAASSGAPAAGSSSSGAGGSASGGSSQAGPALFGKE
jgi:hypothetical protein